MKNISYRNLKESQDQMANFSSSASSSCSSTTLSFIEDDMMSTSNGVSQQDVVEIQKPTRDAVDGDEDTFSPPPPPQLKSSSSGVDHEPKLSKHDQIITQQQSLSNDKEAATLSLDKRHQELESYWAETLAHGGDSASSATKNTPPSIQTRKWDGQPIDLDDEELLAVIVDDDELEDEDEEFERLLLRNLPSSTIDESGGEDGLLAGSDQDSRPSLPALDSRCGKLLFVSHRGAFQRQGAKEISGITMDTALEEIVLRKSMLDEDNQSRPGLPDRRSQRTGRFLVVHHSHGDSHPLQQQLSELSTSGILPVSSRFRNTNIDQGNTKNNDADLSEQDTMPPELPHRGGSKYGKVLLLSPKEGQISAITLEDDDFAGFLARVRMTHSQRRGFAMGDQDDRSQPKIPVRKDMGKGDATISKEDEHIIQTESWDATSATSSPVSSTSNIKAAEDPTKSVKEDQRRHLPESITCGCFPRSRRRTSDKTHRERKNLNHGLKIIGARRCRKGEGIERPHNVHTQEPSVSSAALLHCGFSIAE